MTHGLFLEAWRSFSIATDFSQTVSGADHNNNMTFMCEIPHKKNKVITYFHLMQASDLLMPSEQMRGMYSYYTSRSKCEDKVNCRFCHFRIGLIAQRWGFPLDLNLIQSMIWTLHESGCRHIYKATRGRCGVLKNIFFTVYD